MTRKQFNYLEEYAVEVRQQQALIIAEELLTEAACLGLKDGRDRTHAESVQYLADSLSAAAEDRCWRDFSVSTQSPVWGGDASTTIHFDQDKTNRTAGVHARAEISWASTGRSVQMALHAVACYQRCIEFAAYVEARLN